MLLTLPIREVVRATPRARIVQLDLDGRTFDYAAGQAVLVGAGNQRKRPYSIAGAPEDAIRSGYLELLVGVDTAKVPEALQIIRENCRERSRFLTPVMPSTEPGDFLAAFPVEVAVGGATVFVVPVDSFEKI